MCKIEFKIERTAIANMVLFTNALIVLTIGTVVDSLRSEQKIYSWVDIFNTISEFLVQITLFVFVFEMRSVYIKLESPNLNSCKKNL